MGRRHHPGHRLSGRWANASGSGRRAKPQCSTIPSIRDWARAIDEVSPVDRIPVTVTIPDTGTLNDNTNGPGDGGATVSGDTVVIVEVDRGSALVTAMDDLD